MYEGWVWNVKIEGSNEPTKNWYEWALNLSSLQIYLYLFWYILNIKIKYYYNFYIYI